MKVEEVSIPQVGEVLGDHPYEVDVRIRITGGNLPDDQQAILSLDGVMIDQERQLVVVTEKPDLPHHADLLVAPKMLDATHVWLMIQEGKVTSREVFKFELRGR